MSGLRRFGGRVIVAGSLLQLMTAFLPDARVFMSSNPRVQRQAIAHRPRMWRAQAYGFPIAFAINALGFAAVAAAMPRRRSRQLAAVATSLSAVSTVLWLPIARRRLRIGAELSVPDNVDSDAPLHIGAWTFWPYTVTAVASTLLMGCALIGSGLHRLTGALVAALSGLALGVIPRWRDWPPFLTYQISLIAGVAIARRERSTRSPVS